MANRRGSLLTRPHHILTYEFTNVAEPNPELRSIELLSGHY